jgi:hypothetical protein
VAARVVGLTANMACSRIASVPSSSPTTSSLPTHDYKRNGTTTLFAVLKRGAFRSIIDLQGAINRYIDEHNRSPKPFAWTEDPDKIIAAVERGHQALDSIH